MPPARRLALPFLLLLGALILAAATLVYDPGPGAWPRTSHQLTIWAVVGTSAAGFFLGYNRLLATADTAAARRVILVGSAPLWAAAFATAPFDSHDLGGYVNNGWVQVRYGLNPFVTPVSEIPDWQADPMLVGYWKDTVCAYGFLFQRLARVVVAAGGGDRGYTCTLFKLVNVAALVLTVWLVDRGCERARVSRAAGVYLVAWNPLVLLHGLANGHNDVLAGLGLVAALVAAGSRAWWGVLPALAAAALVKYSTVPLLPLAVVFLVRYHGWLRTAAGAALAAGLVALLGWPYLSDPAALEASRNLANVTEYRNSLGAAVVNVLEAVGKIFPAAAPLAPAAATALKAAGGLAVVGLVAALAWHRARGGYSWPQLVRDAVLVQFVLILLASSKLYGWYPLMFWPAVALLPEASRARRATLLVGLAQSGTFTFLGRTTILPGLLLVALPLAYFARLEAARRRKDASTCGVAPGLLRGWAARRNRV
jgi:hypothetical protein